MESDCQDEDVGKPEAMPKARGRQLNVVDGGDDIGCGAAVEVAKTMMRGLSIESPSTVRRCNDVKQLAVSITVATDDTRNVGHQANRMSKKV